MINVFNVLQYRRKYFSFAVVLLVFIAVVACEAEPPGNHHDTDTKVSVDNTQTLTAKSSLSNDISLHDHKGIHTHFVCPMHPQIVRDEHGKCPICGMDLVAKSVSPVPTQPDIKDEILEHSSAKHEASDYPEVALDKSVLRNMHVQTTGVKRSTLSREIRTQGTVTYDDDYIIEIHPRTAGWIETLEIRTDGVAVKRKDELAEFFSPFIVDMQQRYIEALEAADTAAFAESGVEEANEKVKALHNSLRLLNMMEMDIKNLEKYRKIQNTVTIMAPQGGVITELGVREGMYVEPEDSMFTIVDLSRLWVMVDIYEHQASWVKPGQDVIIQAPALPERKWKAQVEFIYPEVDPAARTLRARIAVNNPDGALLPNMFVNVAISSLPKKNVLVVPRQAVIITGEREAVVKSLGNGRFQPVDIKTGMWMDDQVEVLAGLDENDQVVVSGQFLIDSESSLQAAFSRLSE